MKYHLKEPEYRYSNNINYFALGFLWGIGRFSGNRFLVQYRERSVVEFIRELTAPTNQVFPILEDGKKESYRLYLHKYNPHIFWMRHHGYNGRRGNEQRQIPTFDTFEQEAEFLRGYFLPHHSLDQVKQKHGIVDRLRFYAAKPILDRLNHHLHEAIGTTIKKAQKHHANNVCHILYYASKTEVPAIIEYLHLGGKHLERDR